MASIITNNSKSIWNFFKSQGFSEYGIAGLMGNLYAESGLSPINLENTANTKLGMTDQEYTDAVDNDTYTDFMYDNYGYGLAQWTWRTRKRALYNYNKSHGLSIGDLSGQLKFLISELKEYPDIYNTLKSATSIKEASDCILVDFERPADKSDKVKDLRASYGQQYYDYFVANNLIYSAGGILGYEQNVESNFIKYEVKSGDTLWIIAHNHGISVDDLNKANPNVSLDTILYPGQIILIPINSDPVISNEYNSGSVNNNSIVDNTSTVKPKIKPNLPKLNKDNATKKSTNSILTRFANKIGKLFKKE